MIKLRNLCREWKGTEEFHAREKLTLKDANKIAAVAHNDMVQS